MGRFFAEGEELKQLDSFYSDDDRVDTLYHYLVKGFSMDEIAIHRLHLDYSQPGQIVSVLTRAYGLSGRNSGRYKRQLPDYEDMEAVVFDYLDWPSYENGALADGEFDAAVRRYLKDKQKNRQKQQSYQPPKQTYQPIPTCRPPKQTYQPIYQPIYQPPKQPEPTTLSECLQRARVELAKEENSKACLYYFRAGDIAYEKGDYKQASSIYEECISKTGYYESQESLFRVAYAYSRAKEPLTEADHRYCISRYEQYIGTGPSANAGFVSDALTARGNLTYHYNLLKDYHSSIAWGLLAAKMGKSFMYRNLANAYYETGQWEDAIKWYEAAAKAGNPRNTYRIACALQEQGEYEDAKEEFEALLYDPAQDQEDICEHLLEIAENNFASEETIASYHLELLKLSSCYRTMNGREWLEHAMDNDLDGIAEQMRDLLPDVAAELEEEAAQEEAARFAAEKRRQEQAALLAAEKRRQEQAALLAAEKRRQEQAARFAAEKRRQEQAALFAEEKRRQEQTALLAAEKRRQEETFLLLFL